MFDRADNGKTSCLTPCGIAPIGALRGIFKEPQLGSNGVMPMKKLLILLSLLCLPRIADCQTVCFEYAGGVISCDRDNGRYSTQVHAAHRMDEENGRVEWKTKGYTLLLLNRRAERNSTSTCQSTQLKALPGIGEAYSEKIIKGRPYARKDELARKRFFRSHLRADQIQNRRQTEVSPGRV